MSLQSDFWLVLYAHGSKNPRWLLPFEALRTAAFHTVSAAAKSMKNGGSVVLVSTTAARLGLANHEAIAAAEAGVEGLMRSAAASHGSPLLGTGCKS